MKKDEDILDELGGVAAVNTDEIERTLWQQVTHSQRHNLYTHRQITEQELEGPSCVRAGRRSHRYQGGQGYVSAFPEQHDA